MLKKILIVEDDELLNKMIHYNLENSTYIITSTFNIQESKDFLLKSKADMVLLDVNLGDGSGYDLCSWIKKKYPDTLIIFITARDGEEEQIQGYTRGAIDYIVKPFSIEALQHKIKAMFQAITLNRAEKDIFDDGFLHIDFLEFQTIVDGEEVILTAMEYKLLNLLCKNTKQVLTRRLILERLWDSNENFVDEHTLTTFVSRLRGKIKDVDQAYIKTIYGMGYLWTGGRN